MTDEREESRATSEQEGSEATDEQKESALNPRTKASLLWGIIGVLGFLVLLQGYELATGYRYPLTVKVGTTLVVGLGATGLSYVAEPLLFE